MHLVLTTERVAVGGDCIAREPDGRVVFVSGALPGETVRAEVVSRSKDFWRARCEEVLEGSADRVAAPCVHRSAGCGGCGWQHIAAPAQQRLKVEIVRDALARQGRLPGAEVAGGEAVEPFGYRTTVRFAVTADGSPAFRRGGSHALVPVPDCAVAHPALSGALGSIRAPGADELVLRISEHSGRGTALALGDASHTVISGLPPTFSSGPDAFLEEAVCGRPLRVSAASFFQSSPHSAEALVRAGLEFARERQARVVPACSYVAKFIERHREYQSLLS